MKIKHFETLARTRYFHVGTLPCVVRVMKSSPDNRFIAMHGHEFSELVLVASGTLKHIHKTDTALLKPGDFLVVHPGMRHGYAEPTTDMVVYNLLFNPGLRTYAHLLAGNPLMPFLFPDDAADKNAEILGNIDPRTLKRTIQLLEEIRYEEKSPSPTSSACCGSLFAAVISLLARGLRDVSGKPTTANRLQAEIDYMNAHLGEKITVKQLSAVSGKSPTTLNRFFLADFGKSPIDYLIERRLDEAEILVATTDKTLTQIALRCGFADLSHMLRTFHRHNRPRPMRSPCKTVKTHSTSH